MSKPNYRIDASGRRVFMKNLLAASAAGLVLPQAASGFWQKRADNSIIGHGEFRYRLDKEWGVQDPSKVPVNDCHEMVLDNKGRIFMTTTGAGNDNILIYDRSGKVLDSWGRQFPGAHGLTIHGEGNEQFLLITDPDTHKVFKTTLDGRILHTFGRPMEVGGYQSDDQFKPTETAVGPNGDIYIADGYGQNYIIQYTADGEYIRHFGGTGSAAGEFSCCHGITVDTRGPGEPVLLITSRATQQFKRFTLEGKHLQTFDLPGCSVCRPVIQGENIYFAVIVTDSWDIYDGMLAVLDSDNKVVSFPGGSSPSYNNQGVLEKPLYDGSSFMNPHDVLVDGDMNLYVPQWNSGRTYPVKLHRV